MGEHELMLFAVRSWFRIGTLELMSRNREFDLLRMSLDTIISLHYPDIRDDDQTDRFLKFFAKVRSIQHVFVIDVHKY